MGGSTSIKEMQTKLPCVFIRSGMVLMEEHMTSTIMDKLQSLKSHEAWTLKNSERRYTGMLKAGRKSNSSHSWVGSYRNANKECIGTSSS